MNWFIIELFEEVANTNITRKGKYIYSIIKNLNLKKEVRRDHNKK